MFKFGYFISIGAGKNQLPLILKLKELGLKVIAVDQNQMAPGFKHSEIKIIQSILNYRKVYASLLKLFLDEPIIGVGVRSYGKAILTASYLGNKLGLINTDFQILKKFYNKKTMKEFLGKKGVLVPKAYDWENTHEISRLIKRITYPCILKPVNNISKIGIEVFEESSSLKERLMQLKAKGVDYLLEEFIEGKEITVLGFVQNKKFTLVSISDKITTNYPPFLELSHRLPSTQEMVFGEVKLICQNIANHTGLESSPIVAEFKVSSRGEVFLIEIMPEIGGEYLSEYLIPEYYSYDYFKNYIFLQTGKDISKILTRTKKKQSQVCFIAPPEGKCKYVSMKIQPSEIIKKTFLNIPLREVGNDLNTNDGNSCRVHVIGVSDSINVNPGNLDSAIRKKYDAKFK